MDLEHLNKTQIILLTLLISFVTSIATGIATVSLMEKAPTDVTRVIDRIIERPIETFVPGSREVVTQERTVVVSESELIAKAITAITPSIVNIYSVSRRDELTFKGMGIIVSAEGIVVADSRIVKNGEEYVARLSDGTELTAEPSQEEGEQGFFRLERLAERTFTPATFAAFDALTLGQTVIVLSGETSLSISPGVIAELVPSEQENVSSRIRASIDSSRVLLGSPLIDLKGAVIGMPESEGGSVFISLREASGE
ncbi:MAG: serine protease [Patescibacteria group bacterium]